MNSRTMFPAPLRDFVRCFNDAAFWDSHEVLEGAWRAQRSEFYHGLILYASALVHVQRHNPHGIRAQLAKAVRCLGPHRPCYLGVDVTRLVDEAQAVLDGSITWSGENAAPVPVIHLDTGCLRGDETELADSPERQAGDPQTGARPEQ